MLDEKQNKILVILRNIPVFQGLSDPDLEKIVPLLELIAYPSNSLIINEGAEGDSMFIIKNGSARVTRTDEGHEHILISNLDSGSYFGELSLIDALPRSANVFSNEDTEMFRLNKSDFDTLLKDNIYIANNFYRNCLTETFSRFRHILANFTFAQHTLNEKSAILDDINDDLYHARTVQSYFIDTENLNRECCILEGLRHSYVYEPCIEVGGDFLNIMKLSDSKAGVIIADVEGHGITASLATGILKGALSIIIDELGVRPIELMSFLNKHFMEVVSKLYVTCYYAIIDLENKKVQMSKAGHHHPLFWKKSINGFIAIDCMGPGLGILADPQFSIVEYDIEEGDKILFYTDGIIEQVNENMDMYSHSRMKEKFRALANSGLENILDELFKDLKEFSSGTEFVDDITLLLLEL